MTRDPWKQINLPIDPPIVDRKCQWGTCDKDYAYCINGTDLCFSHGVEQAAVRSITRPETLQIAEQLPLIKP